VQDNDPFVREDLQAVVDVAQHLIRVVQPVDEDQVELALIAGEELVGGHPMRPAAVGIDSHFVFDRDFLEDLVAVASDLEVAGTGIAGREGLQQPDPVLNPTGRGVPCSRFLEECHCFSRAVRTAVHETPAVRWCSNQAWNINTGQR
jgi:hypothetical protein